MKRVKLNLYAHKNTVYGQKIKLNLYANKLSHMLKNCINTLIIKKKGLELKRN